MMNAVASFLLGKSDLALVISTTLTCAFLAKFVYVIIRRKRINREIERLQMSMDMNDTYYADIVRDPVGLFGNNKKYYVSLLVRSYSSMIFDMINAFGKIKNYKLITSFFNDKITLLELTDQMANLKKADIVACCVKMAIYAFLLDREIEKKLARDEKIQVVTDELSRLNGVEELNDLNGLKLLEHRTQKFLANYVLTYLQN